MDYNTQRSKLIIPEYGRHMQELIEHAKGLENLEEQYAHIEFIIDLIEQMYPQARNVEDPRAKLWHHVFQIADYDLKIKPPYKIPTKEDDLKKPDPIKYPVNGIAFKHYGRNIANMLKKAETIEDENGRNEYLELIGSYMKVAYANWHRESTITDENIKHDIVKMSRGNLIPSDDLNFDLLLDGSESDPNRRRQSSQRSGGRQSNRGGRPNQKNQRAQKGRGRRKR